MNAAERLIDEYARIRMRLEEIEEAIKIGFLEQYAPGLNVNMLFCVLSMPEGFCSPKTSVKQQRLIFGTNPHYSIDMLIKKGYLEKVLNPNDQRLVLVRPTEKARILRKKYEAFESSGPTEALR